jgi:hypothetical protein
MISKKKKSGNASKTILTGITGTGTGTPQETSAESRGISISLYYIDI